MNTHWIDHLRELVGAEGRAVRVSIVRADGSAPQGTGAAMTVGQDSFTGTVGGGALELEALRQARKLLIAQGAAQGADEGAAEGAAPAADEDEPWRRVIRDFPLGPALGQCCGGHVQLMFEVIGHRELDALPMSVDGAAVVVRSVRSGAAWWLARDRKDRDSVWPLAVLGAVREMLSGVRAREARCVDDWYVEPVQCTPQPIFLYGAGHVGRALVRVLQDLEFEIYWIDIDARRYPETVPKGVHKLVSADPATAARHAPHGAWHVVMTYSHALDFDICRAVLERGSYGYLGVIASKTKRARFVKHLREAGIDAGRVQDLHAPIGLPGLDGKQPGTIAVSVAADFLLRLEQNRIEKIRPQTDRAKGRS